MCELLFPPPPPPFSLCYFGRHSRKAVLHEWHEKHSGVRKPRDPMVDIAYAFAKEATVLYIDEFQV